ncbi:MAG: 16S rRNA (guanine(527)-N(7))-methyltransferase RsmG, partial [Blastocatellia bacterium]
MTRDRTDSSIKAHPEALSSREQRDEFAGALDAAVVEFGLEPLTERQSSLLAAHFRLLCDWNRKSNLTRITNTSEAARLHYAESIYGAQFVDRGAALLDVGSGAGFPAVPIAVVRSDVRVIALEPNLKKSVFLKEVKDALVLDNLEVVRARLEEFDWSGYEVIATRAVERASQLVPSIVRQLAKTQTLILFCT